MKIIALEEHFATPEVIAAWQALSPELQDLAVKGSATGDIERRLFDLAEERIKLMDEAGIDVQVLSLSTPGVQSLDPKRAVPLAREVAERKDSCSGQATMPIMNDLSITKVRLPYLFAAVFMINTFVQTRPASAQVSTPQVSTPNHPLIWITLGTQGGPIPNAKRSQPANLLLVQGRPWLIDCGDGAVERLAAAGYGPSQVNTVFISHLHMDHIGGLQGLIGLRWFGPGKPALLTIYGPPGTDTVVAGIMKSLKPPVEIGLGVGPELTSPEEETRVVIIKDGSDLLVDGVRVRAVRNSHFDNPPGHPEDDGSQSLSLRFDYQSYGIGYTGDTGPCEVVAHLEKGVNLLVSEVVNLQPLIAQVNASTMPPQTKQASIQHFSTQHLSPQEAGKIAAEAGVQRLVFTHLSIIGTTEANTPTLIKEAHETYKGDVAVAHDLDKF